MVENRQLMQIVDPGKYALETIQDAYSAITNGKTQGKVVISVSDYTIE